MRPSARRPGGRGRRGARGGWRAWGGKGTERLESLEVKRQVSSALGVLSPDQRRCIELAFFEGLTHTQIAERLEAPLGTVKSRILLGMNKLRQALSAQA